MDVKTTCITCVLTRGSNGTKRATVPYFASLVEEGIWAGAVGALTSARDLATWVSMLLNEGKHPYTDEQVIPSHVVEHAATGVTVTEGKASYPELSLRVYRAGQWRYSYRSCKLVKHGGNNPGYKTQVTQIPNNDLAIVSLRNDANGGWLMESAKWRIIDDVLFNRQEPIDWSSSYGGIWANYTRNAQVLTPRPSPLKSPSSLLDFSHNGHTNTQHMVLSNPALFSPPSSFPPPLVDSTNSTNTQNARPYSTLPLRLYMSPIMDSRIAIQTRDRQTPLRTDDGNDEDDGGMLIGLDEHFEVEWVVGEEDGLAFKGGFWGMEGER
ncbi:hypothetical protein D9756_010345 [Leucocoprinus leucothites]|uniref:Uncharacterized protein n=1 Tax=Leucocoprinus leucothites TaxID=201217 RepID=A0A8H5FRA3_9AGAR|nr:hypothetical protein D9756_010345 [Leucoagaricus leucothites]